MIQITTDSTTLNRILLLRVLVSLALVVVEIPLSLSQVRDISALTNKDEYKAYGHGKDGFTGPTKNLQLLRLPNINIPVQDVSATYFCAYYITKDNDVIDSTGHHILKSAFNGGEVYLIGCSSSGATIVTTKGIFCLGNSGYGDIGAYNAVPTTEGIMEVTVSQVLRKENEKVVQIQCGDHNTVLLTDRGRIYVTGYMMYNGMPLVYKGQSSGNLMSYTRVDMPDFFTCISTSYYCFAFLTMNGDVKVSPALAELAETLHVPVQSGISGTPVFPVPVECKKVVHVFGDRIAKIYCGAACVIVVTNSNDVFASPNYFPNRNDNKLKRVSYDIIRDITRYGNEIVASIGATYGVIYTKTSSSKGYGPRLHAQIQPSNPFIDVTINLFRL